MMTRLLWRRGERASNVALMSALLLFSAASQARATSSGLQWTGVAPLVGSGYSGKENAFVYVHRKPAVMYIAGGWGDTPRESPSQAGIRRTTDGGKTWTAIDDGLTNPDGTISSVVNGLWLDQANPSILLAATEFGGTFRSTDGGDTWQNVDASESTRFAQVGSTLYLASRRGILVSPDFGATWSVSLASTAGATTVVTAAGATYGGTADGNVYRLSGSTWTQVGHVGTGAVHDLAVDPFNTSIVYANVDDVHAWNQVLYGSIDGGKRWHRITCPCSIGAQAIAFSTVVPNRLFVGDDGSGSILFVTADGNPKPTFSRGGSTFGADVRYIYPIHGTGTADSACFVVSDQGMFHLKQCSAGSPKWLTGHVGDFLSYGVSVSPAGMVIALQDWGAASGSRSGKRTRFLRDTGEGGETFINPFNEHDCYFAHPDDGLYSSVDGCKSFGTASGAGIASLSFIPGTTSSLYAITKADVLTAQVAISNDAGKTFQPTSWTIHDPYQVAVSPSDPKTILVAAGRTPEKPRLYFSHDGGTSFHLARGFVQGVLSNAVIYYPTHRLYAAFEPNVPGTVLVADHDPATDNILIYRSVDGARSFTLESTLIQPTPQRPWPNLIFPLPDERPAPEIPYYATRFYGNRLAFNPKSPKGSAPAVVLTTRFGAFASFDVGSTWQRIDTNAIAHHFIGVQWFDGYVYLSSFGQGVILSDTQLQ